MMNTIGDLNNYLFEQLERLTDDSLSPEEMEKEIKKANAVTQVSALIIQNGELALRGIKFREEYGLGVGKHDGIPKALLFEQHDNIS